MIRILICCAGGFSSSAMSVKVKKEIEERGLQDELQVDFCPFGTSSDLLDDVDVVMVCPHFAHTTFPASQLVGLL